MKKAIFFLSLFISVLSFGQSKEKQKSFREIYFYGVDYSNAKVLNSPETSLHFKYAFQEINNLFYNEPTKFNVDKYFRKTVIRTSLEAVKDRIEAMDEDKMKISDPNYEIDRATIEEMVKTLPTKESEGVGLIIIGEKVNKDQKKGYYHMVYFDISTREIIDTWKAQGKCGGFGLRNYWATSVVNAMKAIRPT